MSFQLLQKAELLSERNRYREAKKILAELVTKDPNNSDVLGKYGEVLLELNNLKEAREVINNAIGLSPNSDYLHVLRARVNIEEKNYEAAEKCINTAINLNPFSSVYYSLLATLKLDTFNNEEALELSEKALKLDPEDTLGLTARSTALLRLKRVDESEKAMNDAFRIDPLDTSTHANYGWNLLQQGEYQKSLQCFKEALKIDPEFEYAKNGMLQAVKAKFILYRLFVKLAFLLGHKAAIYVWSVLIILFLLFISSEVIALNYPFLQPLIYPIQLLIGIVVASAWSVGRLTDIALRLNGYGKYILTEEEIKTTNVVGFFFLMFLIGIILLIATGNTPWLTFAGFGLTMMVPADSLFTPTRSKVVIWGFTIALVFLGLVAVYAAFLTGYPFNNLTIAYGISLLIFQRVESRLSIEE